MRSTTIPNEAELVAEREKEKSEGLTVFRRPDFVGKKADLGDRASRLEALCERVNEARLIGLQEQLIKLESEREEKLAASIRFEPQLAKSREAAERAVAEHRADMEKYGAMKSEVPQLDALIERTRSLAVKASESSSSIDWLNVHIEDLARQVIASKNRDGKYRVQIGNSLIATDDSRAAEELQRLYHANPDRRAKVTEALQKAGA